MKEGMYLAYTIGRCPKEYKSAECPLAPCVDHKEAPRIAKEVQKEYRKRVRLQQQLRLQRQKKVHQRADEERVSTRHKEIAEQVARVLAQQKREAQA